MFGDTPEEGGLGERPLTDTGAEQAPEIVVVAGHADFSGLTGGAEGFLMKETGLFPERAFGGEDADRKGWCGIEGRKVLGHVGQDGLGLGRPVVGAGTELDLYHGPHVTGRAGSEDGRIVEE